MKSHAPESWNGVAGKPWAPACDVAGDLRRVETLWRCAARVPCPSNQPNRETWERFHRRLPQRRLPAALAPDEGQQGAAPGQGLEFRGKDSSSQRPRPAASSPWGARRSMTAPWWSR